MRLHKRTVNVRLQFDRDNIEDRNAINVEACINGKWEGIGTIPKGKIVKVTREMRRDGITSIKFTKAPFNEAMKDAVSAITLGCYIVMLKRGIWEDDCRYTYNQDLSKI